jgi:hypothetical protein
MKLLERITVEPDKCGGRPCIRGLRIRVTDILEMLAEDVLQYDRRALSQPEHVLETDFPPQLCAPRTLQVHCRRA